VEGYHPSRIFSTLLIVSLQFRLCRLNYLNVKLFLFFITFLFSSFNNLICIIVTEKDLIRLKLEYQIDVLYIKNVLFLVKHPLFFALFLAHLIYTFLLYYITKHLF